MNANQLEALLRPLLEGRGLELESVSVTPLGKRRLIRITVDGDGPEGRGPLLDDVASASNAISVALDEASFVGNAPYTLEVSTRGVSKPLTEPKHFRRNIGRLIKIWLPAEEFIGRLVDFADESATFELEAGERTVASKDIKKAVVQVEMNRPADELDEDIMEDEEG